MALRVMMTCPEKNTPIQIGVESDRGSAWDELNLSGKTVAKCPACGKAHEVVKRESYLEGFAPIIRR